MAQSIEYDEFQGNYGEQSYRSFHGPIDPNLNIMSSTEETYHHNGHLPLQQYIAQDDTPSPSPWALDRWPEELRCIPGHPSQPYVHSESSVSLPWSDTLRNSSTPGDTGVPSPGAQSDAMFAGDAYFSPQPFMGMDGSPHLSYGHCGSFQDSVRYTSLGYSMHLDPEMQDSNSSTELRGQHFSDSESVPLHPLLPANPPSTETGVHDRSITVLKPQPPKAQSPKPQRPKRQNKKTAKKPVSGGVQKLQGQGRRATRRLPSTSASTKLKCTQCEAVFQDAQDRDKHVKTLHTRPFTCVFRFAGCDSTFAAKNEWKRHVASQHLYLEFYHCDYKECANTRSTSNNHRSDTIPQHGSIFNRKDLYVQHVRRMHEPKTDNKRLKEQWEAQFKRMQQQARRQRIDLPLRMQCPAVNCSKTFVGDKAWDERMEHVAHHLEAAGAGQEPPVEFGGQQDPSLTTWAIEVDVIRWDPQGWWRLINPVRGDSSMYGGNNHAFDQDAEGEDA